LAPCSGAATKRLRKFSQAARKVLPLDRAEDQVLHRLINKIRPSHKKEMQGDFAVAGLQYFTSLRAAVGHLRAGAEI
jgi:hypothetical protein